MYLPELALTTVGDGSEEVDDGSEEVDDGSEEVDDGTGTVYRKVARLLCMYACTYSSSTHVHSD